MVQRLEEVDRAIRRRGRRTCSARVLKHFDGHGTFIGTIVEFARRRASGCSLTTATPRTSAARRRSAAPARLGRGGRRGGGRRREPSAKRPKAGGATASRPSSAAAATTVLEGGAGYRSLAAAEPAKARAEAGVADGSRDRSGNANGHADAAAAKAPARARRQAAIKAAVTVAAPAAASSERPQKAAGAPSEPVCDSKRLFEDSAEEAAQLPAGWMIEQKGRGRVFVSPDGLTRFSTLAKVLRWHKQQMALAARFESQQAAQAAKVSEVDVSRTERAEARKPGFEVPEEPKDLGKEGDGKGGDKKKEVPRELRNLAMPDREEGGDAHRRHRRAPLMPTARRAAAAGAGERRRGARVTPLPRRRDASLVSVVSIQT